MLFILNATLDVSHALSLIEFYKPWNPLDLYYKCSMQTEISRHHLLLLSRSSSTRCPRKPNQHPLHPLRSSFLPRTQLKKQPSFAAQTPQIDPWFYKLNPTLATLLKPYPITITHLLRVLASTCRKEAQENSPHVALIDQTFPSHHLFPPFLLFMKLPRRKSTKTSTKTR